MCREKREDRASQQLKKAEIRFVFAPKACFGSKGASKRLSDECESMCGYMYGGVVVLFRNGVVH